jgi:Tol biopolymer transport system component
MTARALPATDGAALPFWSPDSRSLGFFAEGKLKRIDVESGTSQELSAVGRARGGAWNADDVILFAGGLERSLSRINATGGTPRPATTPGPGHRSHRFPWFLPDGRRFLYYVDGDTQDNAGVFVGDLDGGHDRRVLAADTAAIYAASAARLLFVRQTTLFAQSFDVETLQLSGDPVPLADGVSHEGASPAFSVSSINGTLTYRTESLAQQQQFVWIDRRGQVTELVGTPGSYRGMDLSPDGKRLAVHRHEESGGDVWVIEPSGAMTRVTFKAVDDNSSPVWDSTGTRIAFAARRDGRWGVYQKPADGTEADEQLIESGNPISPASWSSGAGLIVYWLFKGASPDQYLLRLADRHGAPLVQSRYAETHGQISPDGRWLAYAANTTDRLEVYVRPFPSGTGVYQVSKAGGVMPRWRSDSRELFYATSYDRSKLMVVSVRGEGLEFSSGPPQELLDTGMALFPHSLEIPTYHAYDVAGDGQRFLVPRPVSQLGDGADTPITVILHWAGLLSR